MRELEACLILTTLLGAACPDLAAQTRPRFFPRGSYEVPDADAELKTMAKAGFNLFVCHDKACLDRVAAAGARAWVPLPMQLGRAPKLKDRVDALKDHPAVAVWEAPDEIVWNLTKREATLNGINYVQTAPEWWSTDPGALDEAYRKAEPDIDKFREGAAYVRELDRNRHPIWLNEAAQSDMKLIRRLIQSLDITGCDDYPVHGNSRQLSRVPDSTDRYVHIGRGRPVWMVLQGFAWREIMPKRTEGIAYPSFRETRWMAWTSITHGASGILYWGMNVPIDGRKSGPIPAGFRQSLYAIASEVAALEPFLIEPHYQPARVSPVKGERGVSLTVRRSGSDWLVALINEDDKPHFDVEVTGLSELNRRSLQQIYGTERVDVGDGAFVTRLLPHEVKLFTTSGRGEGSFRQGRDYAGVQNAQPNSGK